MKAKVISWLAVTLVTVLTALFFSLGVSWLPWSDATCGIGASVGVRVFLPTLIWPFELLHLAIIGACWRLFAPSILFFNGVVSCVLGGFVLSDRRSFVPFDAMCLWGTIVFLGLALISIAVYGRSITSAVK